LISRKASSSLGRAKATAAAGAQGARLYGEADPDAQPVSQIRSGQPVFDDNGVVADQQQYAVKAMPGRLGDQVFEEGPTRHGQEGLWRFMGQGAQTGSGAAGQYGALTDLHRGHSRLRRLQR